jgi:hypothetical protein
MDYKKKYDDLIEYRKCNPLPPDEYGENHHIVPRSICPELENDKTNIVRLSAAEHFKAHYWLFRHYKEAGDIQSMRKMAYALFRMRA